MSYAMVGNRLGNSPTSEREQVLVGTGTPQYSTSRSNGAVGAKRVPRIGIAAGHSSHPNIGEPTLWEWSRCRAAQEVLHDLLARTGCHVVTPRQSVYDLSNDTALRHKVDLFNARGVDLAVELHLNAGGGAYSLALYHSPSSPGKEPAWHIADQFTVGLPWQGNGAATMKDYGRSLYFLRRTNMPAVITEPGFMDNDRHRRLFARSEGIVRYASLVYAGICRWLDTQEFGT